MKSLRDRSRLSFIPLLAYIMDNIFSVIGQAGSNMRRNIVPNARLDNSLNFSNVTNVSRSAVTEMISRLRPNTNHLPPALGSTATVSANEAHAGNPIGNAPTGLAMTSFVNTQELTNTPMPFTRRMKASEKLVYGTSSADGSRMVTIDDMPSRRGLCISKRLPRNETTTIEHRGRNIDLMDRVSLSPEAANYHWNNAQLPLYDKDHSSYKKLTPRAIIYGTPIERNSLPLPWTGWTIDGVCFSEEGSNGESTTETNGRSRGTRPGGKYCTLINGGSVEMYNYGGAHGMRAGSAVVYAIIKKPEPAAVSRFGDNNKVSYSYDVTYGKHDGPTDVWGRDGVSGPMRTITVPKKTNSQTVIKALHKADTELRRRYDFAAYSDEVIEPLMRKRKDAYKAFEEVYKKHSKEPGLTTALTLDNAGNVLAEIDDLFARTDKIDGGEVSKQLEEYKTAVATAATTVGVDSKNISTILQALLAGKNYKINVGGKDTTTQDVVNGLHTNNVGLRQKTDEAIANQKSLRLKQAAAEFNKNLGNTGATLGKAFAAVTDALKVAKAFYALPVSHYKAAVRKAREDFVEPEYRPFQMFFYNSPTGAPPSLALRRYTGCYGEDRYDSLVIPIGRVIFEPMKCVSRPAHEKSADLPLPSNSSQLANEDYCTINLFADRDASVSLMYPLALDLCGQQPRA